MRNRQTTQPHDKPSLSTTHVNASALPSSDDGSMTALPAATPRRLWSWLCAVLAGILLLGSSFADELSTNIAVNGKHLSVDEVKQLEQRYGNVYAGRYWYDPTSGLYGFEGGPTEGQLHAGMTLGGPLLANASGGGTGTLTGVFINGREIHPQEYRFLSGLFGVVGAGRYWLNSRGIGGYEKGPAQFDVAGAIARSQRQSSRGSVYMSWIGGKPGTSVGRASDGCVYISQGDYSSSSC
ncbi:MAG: hypothetical protein AB8F65_00545 [Woeseiaceae bacterium]